MEGSRNPPAPYFISVPTLGILQAFLPFPQRIVYIDNIELVVFVMNKFAATPDISLLTPNEAAKRLSVSPITLRKWADKGLILAITTLGGHRRYPLNEVERLLQRQQQTGVSPIKIMIVDDDPFVGEILQEFLSSLNTPVEVEVANDGFEAGRKLTTFMPNIILLDLMMPGMDGFDVCLRVKNTPATDQIRVIAMTGYPTDENIKRILAAGAEACLAKPVDHAELLAVLNLPQASPGSKTARRIATRKST